MKYVDEFRDAGLAQALARSIAAAAEPGRIYRLMEFCGGHTHALARYGVLDLLPSNIQMIHGPGCPVCVLPVGRIDEAIRLALLDDVILTSYGDVLRVPASDNLSLIKARAEGADIRTVYSVDDALDLARRLPEREVVFLAIGFETTTPPTAVAILQAATERLGNFSVLCYHVLTPPAMQAILQPGDVAIDGLIGPAHVSMVIGSQPYQVFAEQHAKPVVIAGFEPLDLMQAILMLIRQINAGEARVENQFTRAVTAAGNRKAQQLMDEVFMLRDSFEWRGLGYIAHSALAIRPAFQKYDAEHRFGLSYQSVADHAACQCGPVLRGQVRPQDCKLFATVCTPEHPLGACMVSSEGACAAHFTYGLHAVETKS